MVDEPCIFPESPRLKFRAWEEGDFPFFMAMNANPRVMRFFPSVMTEEESHTMWNHMRAELDEKGYGLYAVELKSSGSLIGLIGFHWADFVAEFTPCVEIGWRLVPEAWGHGYATEGAGACLEHGFSRLGFNRVYSFTACVNVPSEAVMQRAGMKKQGGFNHPRVDARSPLYPHVLYVMDASRQISYRAGGASLV